MTGKIGNPKQSHLGGVETPQVIDVQKEKKTKDAVLPFFHDDRFSSRYKPLSQHQLQRIVLNAEFFQKGGVDKMTCAAFDVYSFALIQNVINKENDFQGCRNELVHLFNGSLSGKQVSRHLNNLLTFLHLYDCNKIFGLQVSIHERNVDTSKIVQNQLSLLMTSTLLKAAPWADKEHDPSFLTHLWYFLELEGERKEAVVRAQKNSSNFDLFSDLRNWMLSDAMMSQEPPTSLFEAGAVNSAMQMKYIQGPGMVAAGLSYAIGPFALLAFAVPLLITTMRKVYEACLDAPVHLNPLIDSRKQDYSAARAFIGREDIIKEVLTAWNEKKHPLLVGVPGVGKTAIMEAISRHIASDAIPSLKGKVVFMGSSAELTAPNMMGKPHYQRVVEAIRPHKENVILALDEFHAFFQTSDKSVTTFVRSMLDGSQGSVKYCLFATTQEDYDKFIKSDESLGRRLKTIHVKPLEKDNLLNMLHREAKEVSPHMRISPSAMEKVYEHTGGQQNESRMVFRNVLKEAEDFNSTHPSYKKRELKQAEIEKYKYLRCDSSCTVKESNEYSDKIVQAKKELEEIGKESCFQEIIRDKFKELQVKRAAYASELTTLSKKVHGCLVEYVGKGASEKAKIDALKDVKFMNKYDDHLKKMVFMRYFNHTNVAQFVKNYANFFSLIDVIDDTFVQEYLTGNKVFRSIKSAQIIPLKEDSDDLELQKVQFSFSKQTPLPQVPVGGIKVGLDNHGNTCWLNATLKFISVTTYFDELLIQEPPKGKERLHGFLGDIISSLRKGETVKEEIYLAFMREIRLALPHFEKGAQHDAIEFLICLCDALKWTPHTNKDSKYMEQLNASGLYPRIAIDYKHAPRVGYHQEDELPSGYGKKINQENFTTLLTIDLPQSGKIVDIAQLVEKPDLRFIQPEIVDKDKAKIDLVTNKLPFLATSYLTQLPPVVMIHLKRFYKDGEIERRIDAPIKFDKNEIITLNKYEIVEEKIDGSTVSKLKLKEQCSYRLGACISHVGGSQTESGHYVCDERPLESGTLMRHSDKTVQKVKKEEFGSLGYLLRLDRVSQGSLVKEEKKQE